jgi:hypothetical protein
LSFLLAAYRPPHIEYRILQTLALMQNKYPLGPFQLSRRLTIDCCRALPATRGITGDRPSGVEFHHCPAHDLLFLWMHGAGLAYGRDPHGSPFRAALRNLPGLLVAALVVLIVDVALGKL